MVFSDAVVIARRKSFAGNIFYIIPQSFLESSLIISIFLFLFSCCSCALQSLCCIIFVVLIIALAIFLGIYFGIFHNNDDSSGNTTTTTAAVPSRLLTTLLPKIDDAYSSSYE